MKEQPVEKELVVGGKVGNAHNPVAERYVFVEEFVGPIDVVRGLKTSEQPGNDFCRVVILNLLWFGLSGQGQRGHRWQFCWKKGGQV